QPPLGSCSSAPKIRSSEPSTPTPLGPRRTHDKPPIGASWQSRSPPPLAAPNKCLALSNKPCAGGQATKKRENRAKRNAKRRASNRSDLPSVDLGLHRLCCGLRRDRVTRGLTLSVRPKTF